MANYKIEFFDTLLKNMRNLEGKLTASTEGNLTCNQINNTYWANALFQTFKDMGDVVGMMGMAASCDFSQIKAREHQNKVLAEEER